MHIVLIRKWLLDRKASYLNIGISTLSDGADRGPLKGPYSRAAGIRSKAGLIDLLFDRGNATGNCAVTRPA